jgi:hypothetical protein
LAAGEPLGPAAGAVVRGFGATFAGVRPRAAAGGARADGLGGPDLSLGGTGAEVMRLADLAVSGGAIGARTT